MFRKHLRNTGLHRLLYFQYGFVEPVQQAPVDFEAAQLDDEPAQQLLIDLFLDMRALRKPVIARVNGHALGAGLAILLACDLAVAVEAGCQGTMRLGVTVVGARAHTARPWMGRNAIHRLGDVLSRVAAAEWRRPVIDGCEYREALQAVSVEGGVAGNVVPDRATVMLNHRFAPDRTPEEAEAAVRIVVEPALDAGDVIERIDLAPAAAPGLGHPLLATLIDRNRLEVRAKLGWTDVARFAARGIPAANFGPGEATIAHTADERLDRGPLDATAHALRDLLTTGI